MVGFLLWCVLFTCCAGRWPCWHWVLYPVVWLLLPFRLLRITVTAVFALLAALVLLPAQVLRGR